MCGISGEIRFDGRAVDRAVLEKMMSRLQRRGPDSGGVYIDNPVGFGHRRLSVIDLSEHSNQPMIDDDLGLAIVFNGTIYNYKILRTELQLQGYKFFSEGDTEVIIKAYDFWGEHCVEHLHGMFAFAIWNKEKQALFVARDRMGIKPFYFTHDKNRFRFASNMQALLAVGDIDTSIDAVALHHQLTLHAVIPAPRTILNGVRKLQPGTSMTLYSDGRQQQRQYWKLYSRRAEESHSEEQWIKAIHEALREAVKKRSDIADVPVGVLLSGGLDSSLLVALLVEAGVKDIRTFSIGFEDIGDEKGSEFEYSDQVVARYNTRHKRISIPNADVLKRLPEAVDNMAEPMVGQDAVAFYLLAEQVSKDVKVVQSGQGADEVFGGYFWYPRMQAETGTDLERFRKHYFDRPHEELLRTVSAQYRGEDHTSRLVEQYLADTDGETFLDRVFNFDVTTLIVDDPVKRVDNMTMAWGLEARVPFLDQSLVELAALMPDTLKLKGDGKHVLKQIARGLLPDGVIDRPKGYFPMPALKYVRGDFLNFMRDVLCSDAARKRNLFDNVYIDQLLASPESYMTKLNGSKLWHSALLEFWLQRNVDIIYG